MAAASTSIGGIGTAGGSGAAPPAAAALSPLEATLASKLQTLSIYPTTRRPPLAPGHFSLIDRTPLERLAGLYTHYFSAAASQTTQQAGKKLLGLKIEKTNKKVDDSGTPWVSKRVSFPHGTEFRTSYKGQQYFGKVQNGALVVNGKRYSSPSSAAVSITVSPVNGWRFWECMLPGATKWKTIATLRT